MMPEQQVALMQLARQLVDGFNQQDCSNMLMGLLRQQYFQGPDAVRPCLEDGTVTLLVDHFYSQLGAADARHCKDVLLSNGAGADTCKHVQMPLQPSSAPYSRLRYVAMIQFPAYTTCHLLD